MRKKNTLESRIKDFFKSHHSWRNYGRDILKRLRKLQGTPREIAAGVACGVAISFTPFVGLHVVLAAVTAWIVRGNILASAMGTIVGNPWTFPFIWMSVLYTGRHILGGAYLDTAKEAFLPMFEKGMHALLTFDFSLFIQDVWPILWPMIIGCIPFYFVAWFFSYFLVLKVMKKISRKA